MQLARVEIKFGGRFFILTAFDGGQDLQNLWRKLLPIPHEMMRKQC